jgi:disulfide bond formation protein DsbB
MTGTRTTGDAATAPSAPSVTQSAGQWWTWIALVLALAALAGSLWLSVRMDLKACPLCFYQRTFVMGVVGVLVMGLLLPRQPAALLSPLALPLALAGLEVAAFHEYLEQAGKLECPAGILGVGTAPQQSLVALALLLAALSFAAVRGRTASGFNFASALGAVVLGTALAGSAVVSAPPMPPAPAKAYATPPDICRRPFHPRQAPAP